jgi:hypothetical protein
MRTVPTVDERRLALLNRADLFHHWHSCHESRYCTKCDHNFSGFDVRLSWFRRDSVRLHCPTPACAGNSSDWVHPDNPLVSQEAWEDWERIFRETEAS